MTLALWIGIGLAGGVGAVARMLATTSIDAAVGRRLPVGTVAINVGGAFVLGLLAGAQASDDLSTLAGTGFLGAFTTFSTWMLDTRLLADGGRRRPAVANVAISLALGLLAAWLGRELGAAL